MRSYLDHNATSPLRPSVKAAMIAAMNVDGNASSIHREGRAVRRVIDDARDNLAFRLGCLAQMISFTSGGTEANNMALRGVGAEVLLVSAVEHSSVIEAARATGKTVELIPVDGVGRVVIQALEDMVGRPNTLVSVMLANNETGVIQPLEQIMDIAHSAKALVHIDAVQGFSKMHVNFGMLGCDLMTIAAHKVGGPVGIGALVIRDGLAVEPLLSGGGQELRRRAGTENLPAIAGFGAIAKEPMLDVHDLMDELHDGLEGAMVFSDGVARLQNTECFAMQNMKAEAALMNYDLDGIAVSSGSACSSGKVARSHVLEAMGVAPEISANAIRVSLGWNTTREDVQRFLAVTHKLNQRSKAKAA